MTENEFESIILPFLDYYSSKTEYFTFFNDEKQINIGNMLLFCRTFYIPEAILIFNKNGNVVDGFYVAGKSKWNGKLVSEIIKELENNAEI